MRFAQTDAHVSLGSSWTALLRLRELDLLCVAELRQQGGAGGGALSALLANLRSLSVQAGAQRLMQHLRGFAPSGSLDATSLVISRAAPLYGHRQAPDHDQGLGAELDFPIDLRRLSRQAGAQRSMHLEEALGNGLDPMSLAWNR